MCKAIHISDLHGDTKKYGKLFDYIRLELPDIVLIGGDLYPSYKNLQKSNQNFLTEYLIPNFEVLKDELNENYPLICMILGNDDPATEEDEIKNAAHQGLWHYINQNKIKYKEYTIYGYSYIPPTPFLNKDWELYDVSRYVDPGCTHPTEGIRSINPGRDIEFATIKKDLENLIVDDDLSKTIFLFHSPPYSTNLDRAALDDKFVDHIPLDVHVGSIAIKEFIELRKPMLTLHGHIHESTTITGSWKEKIGASHCFNAATELNLLSVIEFELKNLSNAKRKLY
ncbi:MAG TPA: metallophosphoesterase [Bacteroidales bacterium]|nr:metallophosphoesterase [Bacteroidales bacterium]